MCCLDQTRSKRGNMASCMLAGHAGASAATSAQGPEEEAHLGSEREYLSATWSTTVCDAPWKPFLPTIAPKMSCLKCCTSCSRSSHHLGFAGDGLHTCCASGGRLSILASLRGVVKKPFLPCDLDCTHGVDPRAMSTAHLHDVPAATVAEGCKHTAGRGELQHWHGCLGGLHCGAARDCSGVLICERASSAQHFAEEAHARRHPRQQKVSLLLRCVTASAGAGPCQPGLCVLLGTSIA